VANQRAAILARVLSYERTLQDRIGPSLEIGVLFKQGDSDSERGAREWHGSLGLLADVKIKNNVLRSHVIAYDPQIVELINDIGIDAIVVSAGLNSELTEISSMARAKRILTVGDVASYLERHLTLGIFYEAERYEIVVNLTAAAQERVVFSSNMLKLARVIR
jgi:hypothetical protein